MTMKYNFADDENYDDVMTDLMIMTNVMIMTMKTTMMVMMINLLIMKYNYHSPIVTKI